LSPGPDVTKLTFVGKGVAPCERKRPAVTKVLRYIINYIHNKFYRDNSVILDEPGAGTMATITVVKSFIVQPPGLSRISE
jgi:hypothetical protein